MTDPPRIDKPGDLKRDLAAAAAQIDATHPRGQARPFEQRRGVRPPFAGQQQETFVTFLAAPDHILLHPVILAGRACAPRESSGKRDPTVATIRNMDGTILAVSASTNRFAPGQH